MKRRGWRVTLGAAATGLALVACLVALNAKAVRDHLQAWWFVATRPTKTIAPFTVGAEEPFSILANLSGRPVIYDPAADFGQRWFDGGWLDPLLRELQEKGFHVIA